jgi:nucleotide-binding universal stress UspA family protein
MRAVTLAGRMLGESNSDITLAHVIRGDARDCLDEVKDKINEAFDEAAGRLIQAGVPRERIKTRTISGAQSRAAALVQKASQGDFGTIIMGRRGLSRVKEFFIGRVSNKVIQLVRDQAIWVVS